jgi:hypothetical protein
MLYNKAFTGNPEEETNVHCIKNKKHRRKFRGIF